MLSTILELAGFTALAAASLLVAGVVALLFVVGVELLVIGFALESGGLPVGRVKRPGR